ncbi:predicted protein [Nematostella vectensis]|uniref:Ras-related protein Rab-20 n=1 Tax=Nematostella vectensis TaxID=45351 RepID=A7RU11_NEMVE|nr:predicted protein [Nematostella vectensis]|eukprot:XP_001637063.1 predicted protein [Nematostella vectensis]
MQKPPGKKKADLKIVILGEASVGKTSLIQRYIDRVFTEDKLSTIGASFFLKQWGPYNVAIWDTAGEEKYAGLSSFYCRGASAAIVAYDITKESSLKVLNDRHLHLLQAAEPNCLVVIVGCKKDLVTDDTREITEAAGMELAKVQNELKSRSLLSLKRTPFFETSSKTGDGVDNVFEFILSTCLPLDDAETASKSLRRPTGVNMEGGGATVEKKKCC